MDPLSFLPATDALCESIPFIWGSSSWRTSSLGYLVPPVGENLGIAAYRFNKPGAELARAVIPFVGVLLVGVGLITWPELSLWLVRITQ